MLHFHKRRWGFYTGHGALDDGLELFVCCEKSYDLGIRPTKWVYCGMYKAGRSESKAFFLHSFFYAWSVSLSCFRGVSCR